METEIEETLGDVESSDTGRLIGEAVEHELMLADAGDGELIEVLERLLNICLLYTSPSPRD